MNRRGFLTAGGSLAVMAAAMTAGLGLQAEPYRFSISADRADCRYALGAEATFTVKCTDLAKGGKETGGEVEIQLDDFGDGVQLKRKVDPTKENPIIVRGKLDRPGFLRVVARNPKIAPTLFSEGQGNAVYSVGYAPEKIVQSVPRPADFESYWRGEQARLEREVPLDPKIEKIEARSQGEFNFYLISFATFNGKRVYGALTEPKAPGKYPFIFRVPGAGPSWALDAMPKERGMIWAVINVHPEPVPKDKKAAAKSYPGGEYPIWGILKSREDYFFHDIWLGIDRAVSYLVKRDNVDRTQVLYTGGSQGGGSGLALMALNGSFTRGFVGIPAITDLTGCEVGRISGWPRLLERTKMAEAARKNAPYFDGANFASMITIPIRVTMGLSDTCCPPPAVYSGFNALRSKDKAIFECPGIGHWTPDARQKQVDAWLRAGVRKGTPTPAQDVTAIPAAEFAKYYRQITGSDPAPAMLTFAVDPKISKSGNDAYRITSTHAGVRITGSNGRSLLYGVYDLLARRGGCRWFWDGDVVPKRESIDLSGLDVAEESRFEYRGIRYFAHRGLTRFQAEHWGYEDWTREIDWMLKNRLNFFMPRIGMDDTWQKAYPDIVKYSDPNAPADDNLTGYNNRVPFWDLRYRGELRKRFTDYAFARGMMIPTDFGTMTHWYSRTPVEFLKAKDPPFLPNSNGQYGERTGLVWDIFQGDWLDHYWHLTQTFIDAGYGRPDLLHTIGLGERMCYRDRAKNLQMKKDVLSLLTKKALAAYPDSKILLAGWDFYSTWRSEEVRALLPQLDPNKLLILDYEADASSRYGTAQPAPVHDFTQWGFVGKYPYTFGIFLALEQGLDVRANYDVIRNRQKIAESDPFCKGYILWPESSHTDIVLLDYFTRNAWCPTDLDESALIARFCADRYGARADEFRPLWEKVLPVSQLRGWNGTYAEPFVKAGGFVSGGWEKPANAARLAAWESKSAQASGLFAALANLKWEGEFVRRDTIDLARTALDRILTQRTYSFSRDFQLWRDGKRDGADLPARADNIARLADAMADVLALHTDYSLWETYQRLDAVERVKGKNFPKVLFDNASCGYCRSHQYELARHWYAPRAKAFAAQVAAAVKAGDRSAKALEFPSGEKDRLALMERPLESLKPTLARTEESFRQTMRTVAELLRRDVLI